MTMAMTMTMTMTIKCTNRSIYLNSDTVAIAIPSTYNLH